METVHLVPPVKAPAKSLTNNRFVYEQMRSDIVSGRAMPGAKLNIAACAQELEVSAGAVREALAMLEADSLVVSEPQRGYRVSPVSADDLAQLTSARVGVERLCLSEAIGRGDLEWEGALVATFHQLGRVQEREPDDHDYLSAPWIKAHAAFHSAMVSACANVWLLRMRSTLYQLSERYRHLSARMSPQDRDVHGEHRALLDALLRRDAAAANELISAHLTDTARRLIESPVFESLEKQTHAE
jgi:GntR family carbon starvation induced transcriptional regulator